MRRARGVKGESERKEAKSTRRLPKRFLGALYVIWNVWPRGWGKAKQPRCEMFSCKVPLYVNTGWLGPATKEDLLMGEWQRVGNIWTYVIRVARCRIYTGSEKNGRILQKLVGNLSRAVEQNGPSNMETTTLARKPSVRNNFKKNFSVDTK